MRLQTESYTHPCSKQKQIHDRNRANKQKQYHQNIVSDETFMVRPPKWVGGDVAYIFVHCEDRSSPATISSLGFKPSRPILSVGFCRQQ